MTSEQNKKQLPKLFACRCFKKLGQRYVMVPCFGDISVIGLIVLPFCITMALWWALHRQEFYAWTIQDIFVRKKFKVLIIWILHDYCGIDLSDFLS